MKTAILAILTAALVLPATAQDNALEASKMLRDLNTQIVQAQKSGSKERVLQLQDRYLKIQKQWNVQPFNGNNPPPAVPAAGAGLWQDSQQGTGSINAADGTKVRVASASARIPGFWGADGNPTSNGRGATVTITDVNGKTQTFNGKWAFKGAFTVSLVLNGADGTQMNGSLTMAQGGPAGLLATVNLNGTSGPGAGVGITFAKR